MVRYRSAHLAVTLLLTLFVSCNLPRQRAALILHDSITFQVRKPAPDFCPAMFYHENNGRGYLFADDRNNREIRLFCLDSAIEVDPIPVRDTGANAIPYHFGFVVWNMDTLFLPGSAHNLICINRNGEILKQVDFSALSKTYGALSVATSASRFTTGAVVLDNEIFFIQKDSRKNYSERKPSDYRFLFRYNVRSDSFTLSPISLPDDFWKDGKQQMALFLTYNDLQKCFVFGAMYSDNIYVSHDGKSISRSLQSRSKAIREFFPYSPANEGTSEDYLSALYHYSYNVALLWDPDKKIYYRFVWPGVPETEKDQPERGDRDFNNFPAFTIEILDLNFNTIGTFTTPENMYNWNNYFLTKDGLYLAVNSSARDSEQKKWKFHLFRLQSL